MHTHGNLYLLVDVRGCLNKFGATRLFPTAEAAGSGNPRDPIGQHGLLLPLAQLRAGASFVAPTIIKATSYFNQRLTNGEVLPDR